MKYLTTTFYFLLLFSLIISCSSFQSQHEIKLDAGNWDRPEAPMYTDVLLPAVSPETPVCLSDGNIKIPGQIENIGSGIARVWWLQPAMKAGETQTWTIFIGKSCSKNTFEWIDNPGVSTKLLYNQIPVIEYMYQAFDPNQPDENQKPYHQVYSPDGSELVTKGLGGLYPHHRGIFFGYRNVVIDDSTYNFWASQDGDYTEHQTFISQMTGPVFGGHTLSIDWITRHNETVVSEIRSVRAFKLSNGSTLIDFETHVEGIKDYIILDGDRQHAGVQFRAAQYAADHKEQTRYLRPAAWADLPADQEINDENHKDLPWNALQYSVDENQYTVVYMSAPSNPDNADFSERLYGRFGEFIRHELLAQTPLDLHYQFLIINGHDLTRNQIDKFSSTLNEPVLLESLDN